MHHAPFRNPFHSAIAVANAKTSSGDQSSTKWSNNIIPNKKQLWKLLFVSIMCTLPQFARRGWRCNNQLLITVGGICNIISDIIVRLSVWWMRWPQQPDATTSQHLSQGILIRCIVVSSGVWHTANNEQSLGRELYDLHALDNSVFDRIMINDQIKRGTEWL